MRKYTFFQNLSRRSRRENPGLKLASALLCLFFCGCGATEPPQPAKEAADPDLIVWPREEKAIRIEVNADRDLNMYESKAHSLQICVYQLDNPGAFSELAKTQDGINVLLKAEPFDKSVKNVSRLFIQPFENNVFHLDRVEYANFVGIVCGYFDSTPENCAKVWEIPPRATTTGHLFWKETKYRAGTLDLDLHLTDRAMAERTGPEQEPQ